MKYHTQFKESNQTVGTNLAGWTVRSGAPSRAPTYGVRGVIPVGRMYLPITNAAASVGALSWDALDSDAGRADVNMVIVFVPDLMTASTGLIYVRGQAHTDWIRLQVIKASGLSLDKSVASVITGAIATSSVTFAAGKTYAIRLRASGTTVQVRAWEIGARGMAGEPTTWNINTTVTGVTAAGWVGLGGFHATTTDNVFPVVCMAVGTNGDSAVCPRTNAERAAWLGGRIMPGESGERRVVAELSATGYDSGGSPYTKTVNWYISKGGYISHPQDTPANQPYDDVITAVPTLSRSLAKDLVGGAGSSFGNLNVSNPSGIRDRVLRMRWKRDYVRVLIGDKHWPLHDFIPMIVGRLGTPTASSRGSINFPIADLADFFNRQITGDRFSSGDFIDMVKPTLIGNPRCVEIQIDTATLVGTINNGALGSDPNDGTYRLFDCVSNGFAHIGGQRNVTISSVDTATDVITTSANHLFAAGYRIQVMTGVAPGGMSTLTNYWVLAAGRTANTFKVTDTYGSTTPVKLSSAGSGPRRINSFGYTFDTAAGTVTLVSPLAGRCFCFVPNGLVYSLTPSQAIAEAAFTRGTLSLNFKDQGAFDAAHVIDGADGAESSMATRINEAATVLGVLDRLAAASRAWYGFSPDGLMQTGAIGLPGTVIKTLVANSEVKLDSLKQLDFYRAINFAEASITSRPWYSLGDQPKVPGISLNGGDDYGVTSAEIFAGHSIVYPGPYGAAGIPLDDHPDQLDADTTAKFQVDSASTAYSRLVDFFKKQIGVWEFQAKLSALLTDAGDPLSLGDTISLEHERMGWKLYTGGDDASPDNTGDVDARKAVVMAIDVNLESGDPFPVRIKCYRQDPGYYPTANLN